MTLEYTRRLGELLPERPDPDATLEAPDRRDGRVYLLPEDLRLAVEVAMTTGRPLLLRGEPGSGKSSLAPFLARNLGYRYYEKTITSATRAQDLLWHFDAVRRLSDAQVKERKAKEEYVEPGVLWWAFNADSARRRGLEEGLEPESPATEPDAAINAGRLKDRAVVLIDEIDKADPDVPNGLLEPLSATTFVVQDTNATVKRTSKPHDDELSHLLVVITTNEERDLPPAFVRRCIVFTLAHPTPGPAGGDRPDASSRQRSAVRRDALPRTRRPGGDHARSRRMPRASNRPAPRSTSTLCARAPRWTSRPATRAPGSCWRPPRSPRSASRSNDRGRRARRSGPLPRRTEARRRPHARARGRHARVGVAGRGGVVVAGPAARRRRPHAAPRRSAALARRRAARGIGRRRPGAPTAGACRDRRAPARAPWRAATPLEPFDPARHLAAPARRAPLFDPRWTRELLASLLATEVADGRLDEAAAIALIAAGRPLDPFPQLTRRSLRRGAQVLVDVGEGMEPFVDDAWDLVERIERIAGEANVSTHAFWDAPLRGLAPDLDAYEPPSPLTPVLAVTDAGIGGPSPRIERSRAAEWLALAERLAERGSPLILIVPYRRDRWPDGSASPHPRRVGPPYDHARGHVLRV